MGCNGNVVPFLRYAYAHRGLNQIRQNLSVGVVLEEVLGQNFDLLGVAGSWMEPSNRKLDDQYIIEAYYRVHLTPNMHFTPDFQWIIHPSKAPQRDSVFVGSLRLRTLF